MTPLKMSEDDWQARITDTAELHGWRWAHFRAAQVRPGQWATPQSGHPGFPDLVLARDGVLIVPENKTDEGRFRPGQPEWLEALGTHGRLWRPRNWPEIHAELTTRRKPA
jgi:hypothetical protein